MPRPLPSAVKLAPPILNTARVTEFQKFDDGKIWYRVDIIPAPESFFGYGYNASNHRLSFVASRHPFTIWRRFDHFVDFHAALALELKKDPSLASGRRLPSLPKSRFFVTRAVCEDRRVRLEAYLRDLLVMPERVTRNILFGEFFGLWFRDVGPGNTGDPLMNLMGGAGQTTGNVEQEISLDEPWLKPVEEKRQSMRIQDSSLMSTQSKEADTSIASSRNFFDLHNRSLSTGTIGEESITESNGSLPLSEPSVQQLEVHNVDSYQSQMGSLRLVQDRHFPTPPKSPELSHLVVDPDRLPVETGQSPLDLPRAMKDERRNSFESRASDNEDDRTRNRNSADSTSTTDMQAYAEAFVAAVLAGKVKNVSPRPNSPSVASPSSPTVDGPEFKTSRSPDRPAAIQLSRSNDTLLSQKSAGSSGSKSASSNEYRSMDRQSVPPKSAARRAPSSASSIMADSGAGDLTGNIEYYGKPGTPLPAVPTRGNSHNWSRQPSTSSEPQRGARSKTSADAILTGGTLTRPQSPRRTGSESIIGESTIRQGFEPGPRIHTATVSPPPVVPLARSATLHDSVPATKPRNPLRLLRRGDTTGRKRPEEPEPEQQPMVISLPMNVRHNSQPGYDMQAMVTGLDINDENDSAAANDKVAPTSADPVLIHQNVPYRPPRQPLPYPLLRSATVSGGAQARPLPPTRFNSLNRSAMPIRLNSADGMESQGLPITDGQNRPLPTDAQGPTQESQWQNRHVAPPVNHKQQQPEEAEPVTLMSVLARRQRSVKETLARSNTTSRALLDQQRHHQEQLQPGTASSVTVMTEDQLVQAQATLIRPRVSRANTMRNPSRSNTVIQPTRLDLSGANSQFIAPKSAGPIGMGSRVSKLSRSNTSYRTSSQSIGAPGARPYINRSRTELGGVTTTSQFGNEHPDMGMTPRLHTPANPAATTASAPRPKRLSALFRSHSLSAPNDLPSHFIQLKALLIPPTVSPTTAPSSAVSPHVVLLKLSRTVALPDVLSRLTSKFATLMNDRDLTIAALQYRDAEDHVITVTDDEDWIVCKDVCVGRLVCWARAAGSGDGDDTDNE
ncbi:hypothetical protein DFS34DRAFT_609080 [Phlyctochytrium arcticum]|nr:hypothetical protein DFS34DRAFT_609080 [Phlyctochytrium arcticum]